MLMLRLLIYLVVAIELSICFFIHSLAPPFLSLVVVLCDVGVNALGPPNRASIRTPRVIPKAVKIETIVIPCSLKGVLSIQFISKFFILSSITSL